MYFIDTHTHIYLPEFEDDRAEMMQRARSAGVEMMMMPAIDSSTHEAMLQLELDYEHCHSMMGLHPCSVNQDHKNETGIVKEYLAGRKFIAIGEIGLDFYWDKTFLDQQYKAFHAQIELALQYQLPIVIHSRNATDECIEVVKQYPDVRGVFHCFSGNEEQAGRISELGVMLGIGGVVSFKNAGLDKVMERVDRAHVVLETDAPYLAPVPYRGKRNEPSYLKNIAEKLAAVWNCPVEEVAEITSKNAKKLFKLPSKL
jgi:TatD DNase family protein